MTKKKDEQLHALDIRVKDLLWEDSKTLRIVLETSGFPKALPVGTRTALLFTMLPKILSGEIERVQREQSWTIQDATGEVDEAHH